MVKSKKKSEEAKEVSFVEGGRSNKKMPAKSPKKEKYKK